MPKHLLHFFVKHRIHKEAECSSNKFCIIIQFYRLQEVSSISPNRVLARTIHLGFLAKRSKWKKTQRARRNKRKTSSTSGSPLGSYTTGHAVWNTVCTPWTASSKVPSSSNSAPTISSRSVAPGNSHKNPVLALSSAQFHDTVSRITHTMHQSNLGKNSRHIPQTIQGTVYTLRLMCHFGLQKPVSYC